MLHGMHSILNMVIQVVSSLTSSCVFRVTVIEFSGIIRLINFLISMNK